MKMWGGKIVATSLTSALDGGKWSASHPSHFSPSTLGTHRIEWVGSRLGVSTTEKSCPAGNRTRTIQLVAPHYTEPSRLLKVKGKIVEVHGAMMM